MVALCSEIESGTTFMASDCTGCPNKRSLLLSYQMRKVSKNQVETSCTYAVNLCTYCVHNMSVSDCKYLQFIRSSKREHYSSVYLFVIKYFCTILEIYNAI